LERLMVGLRAFPGALLFATHDLRLTLRHATRAIVMVDGQIVQDGPPQEALRALPEPSPLPLPPLHSASAPNHPLNTPVFYDGAMPLNNTPRPPLAAGQTLRVVALYLNFGDEPSTPQTMLVQVARLLDGCLVERKKAAWFPPKR
jgi:ABC-type glutathione transport system ATPase component